MRLGECPREPELSDALRAGRWPAGSDAALGEHVDRCESCRSTALIAHMLREDRAEAIRAMPLASPGLLWWRAQILQRQAAIRQASRPIHVAIAISLAVSAIVVGSVLFSLRSQIANWISAMAAVPVSAQPGSISSPVITSLPILFILSAVTALAAIGGFAIYAAVHRK